MSQPQYDLVPSGFADDRVDLAQDISWVVTDLDGTIVGCDLQLVERSVAACSSGSWHRRCRRSPGCQSGRGPGGRIVRFRSLGRARRTSQLRR